MNILVVSLAHTYKETFEKHENIHLALVNSRVEEKYTTDISAILLDGEVITHNELADIRYQFPELPIYYKLHNIHNQEKTSTIQRICSAHKIQAINEYYTVEQVVNEVTDHLFNRKEQGCKRVISFFGTHSGVGVSTTALNVGHALAEKVQEKVLVLSLNTWDPADYFYNYNGLHLNDLKVDLKTGTLTAEKLTASLSQYKNLYHLAGNRDIKQQRFYQTEEIHRLIEVAKNAFDVIIIDAGTHFDNAGTAQSFVSSNLRFLVTNQEEKGYLGYFPYVFQQILEPIGAKKSDFMLIINQFVPMSLIAVKDLSNELEMGVVSTVPDMNIQGSLAIRDKKLLYEYADETYKQPLHTITNLIISEANLTEITGMENGPQRKKLLSLFGSKGSG